LPFKKPIEFNALCAKSRKEMLNISPAAKPCRSPSILRLGVGFKITNSAPEKQKIGASKVGKWHKEALLETLHIVLGTVLKESTHRSMS
jgi:hypothetical protein